MLARAGQAGEAIALAREAVGLLEPTDLLSHRADAMLDLAEVLRACAQDGDRRGAVQTALQLYEAKGNVAAAARARRLLDPGQG
jgi:hypothetical protein